MKFLLDTHTLLWFVLGNENLSKVARRQIEDSQNDTLISPASYWEIAIKISMGKYALPVTYEHFIEEAIHGNGFHVLPILPKHTALLTKLPFHHRDPFDRLMIAQATVEQIPIVSKDAVFDGYPVARMWE